MWRRLLTTAKDLLTPSHCEICGEIILGPFYMDGLGRKICMTHKEADHCISCGGFCSPIGSRKLSDGSVICSACQANVPSSKDGSIIEAYIRRRYQEFGLGSIPQFSLDLVEMENLVRRMGKTVLGYAEERNGQYRISILKHLSKTPYAGVLAHEMLHLWQMSRNLHMPNDISEGFCNLGAYEILKGISTKISDCKMGAMEKDPDLIYGEGFRRVKSIFDKEGWNGVIARMHN